MPSSDSDSLPNGVHNDESHDSTDEPPIKTDIDTDTAFAAVFLISST